MPLPRVLNARCLALLIAAATLTGSAGESSAGPSVPPLRAESSSQPASGPAATQPSTLENARGLYLSGDYAAAATMYEHVALDSRQRVAAAVGRADVDIQTGDYSAGVDRLRSCEKDGVGDAQWNAALAELETQIGRYDDALAHNRKALEIEAGCLRARRQLGALYEMLGRIDDAIAILKPLNAAMTGGKLPESAEDLTDLGEGFLRYTVLTRHPERVNRTRHVLQNVYQEAFEFADTAYWPARLAAAKLLLDEFNLGEAETDLKKLIQLNPKIADARVALGLIGLIDRWDFEAADKAVTAALAINPHHVGARCLQAQARMTERRYGAAAAAANKAVAVNPNDIEALSLLAAAQLRLGDEAASKATQDRVFKLNPKPARLHYVLGLWLVMGRQFDEAEAHFKKAIELAPYWSPPRTELGVMYMETGEEAAARRTLDESFELDRFNHRTFNILELLDEIEKFDRLKTPHFVVKYNRESDAVAAPYLAEALEKLHDDVCRDFAWTPDKPTLIELFPSHASFSVRIAGRPFIATVGACTGRCIAMVAPRGGPPFGRFNWASTLRHEFTHTVTLGATGNRIPHWMTEGLAVHEEPHPRPWAWKEMLAKTVVERRLFTLETLDWGFMRPRRPDDRNLAYAQSEWMIEFIESRFGKPAVLELLKAFREKKGQKEAFVEVLKIDTHQFDADFAVWAAAQVKKWGLRPRRAEPVEAMKSAAEASPEDANVQAQLAWSLLADDEAEDAETAAKKAIELDADQVLGHEVLALIYVSQMLAESDEDERDERMAEARPHIRRLAELAPTSPVAMKFTGYLEQHDQEWREALKTYAKYLERFPEDPDPYRRMAGIDLKLKDVPAALERLEKVAAIAEEDAPVRRQIAAMRLERGEAAEAATWAKRALEIDPYDSETHALLGEAALNAGDLDVALRGFEAVHTLAPKDAAACDGLARVWEAKGDKEKSAKFRQESERLGKDKKPTGADRPQKFEGGF